jgi:iron complex outermembrane receptor protein
VPSLSENKIPAGFPAVTEWLLLVGLFALAGPLGAQIAVPPERLGALKKLSLEELMDIEVTSVSKRSEKLSETASAIQVITGEQIRRSGATTLPQALRLATNLQAAQVNASYWTIGARGFNSAGTTSNKLLVMIDGRSVYSPLFSGTFWDTQDVFLPDVERIEVISGPGGATWGANAVNGVISILTKGARDTQGILLYGGAGEEESILAGLRYGGRFGHHGYFRVYAKHLDFDGTVRSNGTDAGDRYVLSQTGFRADWGEGTRPGLTFQGDFYDGFVGRSAATRGKLSGGNLLARWTREPAPDAQVQVQAYYDYAWRWAPTTFADRLETLDLDAQHQFQIGERHLVVWGINSRIWIDHVRNTPTQAFIPADDTIRLAGLFAQDEIELSPDRLRLTLGAKFEYSDYSGSDIQPSLRLAWLASPTQTLWAAASRAVRTPSRLDRDFFQPPSPPFVVAGGPDFSPEELLAYELGWRGQPAARVSAAVTLFHHDYDDLRSLEPGSPRPFHFANGVAGHTQGAEFTIEHQLTDRWRWNAGYTWLRQRLHLKPGSQDLNQARAETSDPEHQFQVHTAFDFPGEIQLDLGLRRVDSVPVFAGGVLVAVPAYTELDARIAWMIRPDLELSVAGRNLLHARHPETGQANNRREIERSVHGKITWRY